MNPINQQWMMHDIEQNEFKKQKDEKVNRVLKNTISYDLNLNQKLDFQERREP